MQILLFLFELNFDFAETGTATQGSPFAYGRM